MIHSDLTRTGNVETGNKKLNRFFLNTVWGQRGNFLDVPTDCPQRDERLGWTGDIQAFSGTASFHYDCSAFFNKFVWDMIGLQKDNLGSVPFTVPEPVQWWVDRRSHGSAAWGDAATVVPWTAYVRTGDRSLLRKMYPAMKMWVDYIQTRDDTNDGGRRLWLKDWHFADWLALDNYKDPLSSLGATDHFYVASAYYARSTELTLRAAEALGLYADAEKYRALLAEIKDAIQKEYFSPNGRCAIDTQTAYVMALAFDLVPAAWRKRCADTLAKKIEDNKWALDTGFIGTHLLCRVLGETGHADIAYKLLLREEYPSWIYEVDSGATTVWERWNGQGPASRPEFLSVACAAWSRTSPRRASGTSSCARRRAPSSAARRPSTTRPAAAGKAAGPAAGTAGSPTASACRSAAPRRWSFPARRLASSAPACTPSAPREQGSARRGSRRPGRQASRRKSESCVRP